MNVKSTDFQTNWIPEFLPIGSLWLETSATAWRGPYVKNFTSRKNIKNTWKCINTIEKRQRWKPCKKIQMLFIHPHVWQELKWEKAATRTLQYGGSEGWLRWIYRNWRTSSNSADHLFNFSSNSEMYFQKWLWSFAGRIPEYGDGRLFLIKVNIF